MNANVIEMLYLSLCVLQNLTEGKDRFRIEAFTRAFTSGRKLLECYCYNVQTRISYNLCATLSLSGSLLLLLRVFFPLLVIV